VRKTAAEHFNRGLSHSKRQSALLETHGALNGQQNPTRLGAAKRIAKHSVSIDASLGHPLPNGLVESSTNTKVRLLTREAFGFKSPEAMLNLGGYCPTLPGRRTADVAA